MTENNTPEVVSFEYEYLEHGIYMVLGTRTPDGHTNLTFINKNINATDGYTDEQLLAIAMKEVGE